MSHQRTLGHLSLAFLNVSAIISLRHLPAMASYGLWSIIFYLLAALIFLTPVALICAELASTWPQRGGLYNWILLSLGPRMAFFSVWWSWMAAIVTILLNLTFLSVTIKYAFFANQSVTNVAYLAQSLSALWGLTLLNVYGMRLSALLSSISLVAGTIIPVGFIFVLSILGLWTGQSDFAKLNFADYQTSFYSLQSFFFFSSVVVGYAGIELAAFHAADAKNPQKDYSKAILLSSLIIVALYVIGTSSLVLVLPQGDIDKIGGLVQFFHVFFKDSEFTIITKIVGLVLAVGSLGATNTWLISPAKGVFAAMEHYEFPHWLTKTNQHDVPVPLLILQAAICSVLLIGISLMHSSEQCFWILTALTTQFSLTLYILMAVAIFVLRKTCPETNRPFAIPQMWLKPVVATTLFVCFFVILSTLIPLENMDYFELIKYEAIFIIGWIILSVPPIFFQQKASAEYSDVNFL